MSEDSFKAGFCDGVLGRKSENPYAWEQAGHMIAYNRGYGEGKQARIDKGIIIRLERDDV